MRLLTISLSLHACVKIVWFSVQATHYTLTVTVRDHGTPSQSAAVTVLVTVGDVNDNPPRFDRDIYSAIVQVGSPHVAGWWCHVFKYNKIID